jgi:chromosome segregation ATPase
MLPAILVAQFSPLSPAAQTAIVSVLAIIVTLLVIRSYVRRDPPLDTELKTLSLAISGLQQTVSKLTSAQEKHATHETEIDELKTKVASLEALREKDKEAVDKKRDEDLSAQRKYTRETTKEIFDKLDHLQDSFSKNFQLVERTLGNVEGQLKGLTDRVANVEHTVKNL